MEPWTRRLIFCKHLDIYILLNASCILIQLSLKSVPQGLKKMAEIFQIHSSIHPSCYTTECLQTLLVQGSISLKMDVLIKISENDFVPFMILVIQWGHNFAHGITAQLSWHVQNYDLIGTFILYVRTTNIFTRVGLWAHKLWSVFQEPINKVWWLCLVPTSTTRFASDVGYRMAKIKHSCTRKIFFMNNDI